MNRRQVGEHGEQLARAFLKKQSCRVLETNYRTRQGEIDIVCRQGDTVVFVEVKTRTSRTFGEAVEAVDDRKRSKLHNMAQEYVISHGLEAADVRFDVLGILLGPDGPQYDYITGAF